MDGSLNRQPVQVTPPASSARPTPERPLRLRDSRLQRYFGMFLIGVCLFGCMFVALFSSLSAARERTEFQRLQQAGITTQAQVISRTDVGRGSDRLTYSFIVASPAGVRQSFVGTTIIERARETLSPSGQIMVIYDPADPRVSRLSQDSRPPASVLRRIFPFCWLGWLPLLVGVVTAMLARRREKLAQQLDRDGQITSGIVIERWHARGRQGGPCATYQFDAQLPDGQSRRIVKAEIVDLVTRFQQLQAGMLVQVRYLLDDPNVCRIEWS
jgi:hypothetical protein